MQSFRFTVMKTWRYTWANGKINRWQNGHKILSLSRFPVLIVASPVSPNSSLRWLLFTSRSGTPGTPAHKFNSAQSAIRLLFTSEISQLNDWQCLRHSSIECLSFPITKSLESRQETVIPTDRVAQAAGASWEYDTWGLDFMKMGVRPGPENPYPISDQNIRFSIPYFRPDSQNVYPISDPVMCGNFGNSQ